MKERPIIFSAPMVRAILDGRKSVTRRLATSPLRKCEPGDRLWVRETWAQTSVFPIVETIDRPMVVYREFDNRTDYGGPWRSPIHMPRWASRITLEVTGVKVERLQDISEDDALAEGVYRVDPTPEELASGDCTPEDFVFMAPGTRQGWRKKNAPEKWGPTAAVAFRFVWESLHGAGSWAENPEVVAISFRRVVPS